MKYLDIRIYFSFRFFRVIFESSLKYYEFMLKHCLKKYSLSALTVCYQELLSKFVPLLL